MKMTQVNYCLPTFPKGRPWRRLSRRDALGAVSPHYAPCALRLAFVQFINPTSLINQLTNLYYNEHSNY
jgi:hypothetical protein